MISSLNLINLPPSSNPLPNNNGDVFIIKTCQRTIILGFNQKPSQYVPKAIQTIEQLTGKEAYQFVLETICGLKSKLLGEHEIVNQFKDAYTNYINSGKTNSHILSILEKIFKDAKEVRKKHLTEIGLLTYAGIARKILIEDKYTGPVIVYGSGQLAEDLLRILIKKFEVTLCARNEVAAKKLIEKYGGNFLPFEQRNTQQEFQIYINTIGTTDNIFTDNHLNKIQDNENFIFIDMTEPSPIPSSFNESKHFFRLDTIFKKGKELGQKNQQKIESALKKINDITQHRHTNLSMHVNHGWDELIF